MREETPETYEVYFVLDVSGSMTPFLTKLRNEIVSFTESIPERDAEGRRTRVDYYVVAFVNDVKWFPEESPRLTSAIGVQDALDRAIEAGRGDLNLTQRTYNAEPAENLLDAVTSVTASAKAADARLMLIATDAPFAESPTILSSNIRVQSSFARVRETLAAAGFRIHAFTPDLLDGVTREYEGTPPLTDLPGSTKTSLRDLVEGQVDIATRLSLIAEEASCN
ncbi:MAG: hypothetical protein H6729_02595 [Deltaproteobacteria bacterium]|nr:hypothetical protein [Deltaproteobacteria bacterium]